MKQPTYATTQLWADLVCISCTRKAATRIAEKGKQTVIRLEPGVHPEYARRRVCQACRGPLWFTDPDTRTVPHKLPDSEIRPGPGRPRRSSKPKPSGAPKTVPCGDCGEPTRNRRRLDHPRCWDCMMRRRTSEAEARYREVAEILGAAGRPLRSREIAERLGCNHNRASDLIRLARRHGIRIESVGKSYALEAAS